MYSIVIKMSHKWIPQWKKDQEAAELVKKQQEVEIAKGMEKTEQNFPPLSRAIGSSRVVVWEKKFSELASDWKSEADKHIEEEKMQQEFAKSQITKAPSVPVPKTFKLPVFANKHRYVEEEEEEEKPKQAPPSDLDDSGWTLVDTRKVRRKKTFEEVVNRPPTPEEDGVWKDDAPAEHETCWEDRR
jgi:hypothetical protein